MTSPTTWCMWYTLNCHCRRGACGEGEGWGGGGEGWEGEDGVEVKLNKGEWAGEYGDGRTDWRGDDWRRQKVS